jgi:tetratricopeptide (TPR) repeat protein
MEALVDAGIPALALLAIAIVWGARVAAREGWPAGAAALIALAVCAAGDSPLRQPAVALLLGLVLAGCDPRREPRKRLHFALRAGALVSAALLLAIAVGGWMAARRLTAAKEALPSARRALLASAARLDPRSGEALLERGLLELEEGDAEAATLALRRSRALVANVGTDVAIGNAEVLRGDHEAAVEAYLAALRRHPGSFRAHANITQALLALGRIDEAERHLAIAAALWPGHPRLGEVAEQIKRARIDRATSL